MHRLECLKRAIDCVDIQCTLKQAITVTYGTLQIEKVHVHWVDIISDTVSVFVSVWGPPFWYGYPLLFDTHQLLPYTKCRHHENFTQNFSWSYWKRSEVSTTHRVIGCCYYM